MRSGVRSPYGPPRRGKSFGLPQFFVKITAALYRLPLLFRKKAHSRRLFACKRAHNAFGSLPPFCECAPLAHSVSKPFGFPMLQRRRCASFAQNACRRTEFINLNHAHFLHLLIFFNEHVIIITATQLLKGAIWLFGKSRAK